MYRKIIIFGLVALSIIGCSQRKMYSGKRFLMGTIVEVVSPYPEAIGIAFKEIERVENIFSIYRKDSPVAHLNKTGFLNTNFEITLLVEKSKRFYELTGGQFDITVGTLTKIWKQAFQENRIPNKAEIKNALALVGLDKVYIDRTNNSIMFNVKGMQIDFGAIAKGYAVDCAVKELKIKGIDSAIVNVGGNLYCLGSKSGQSWQIGLQHPRTKNKLFTTLKLKDLAVATSGDYEQYMEINKKRYSHIINPKTGYPVDNNVMSVTVIAKDAMTADAVGTCVFLLGKEKGTAVFNNYPGVEKIIVITKSDVQNN
ncbi:MAG: FAD:protein FMN transferase [Candidatus Omnitrophica bacterium]|nr:FAD:protein FMN transferase [Candidatus Omnitrophota bacterium]MDD5352486.1 FAD:protein FMN transferase [Candidatus Omnitrophota bacterium]MDD5550084.1 FAD:protein FMN transferase [Candidatus Omnitrophota bacterium]